MSAGQGARRAAARLLSGALVNHRMLSELTAKGGSLDALTPPERARAMSIATGVLRFLPQIDAVLDPMLQRPPPIQVKNALRVAAWELLIDGVAEYAAVDGAVNSLAGGKQQSFRGLTNAVARRLTREGAEALAALPPPEVPGWMAKPMLRAYGPEAVAAIACAHQITPAIDLTPKEAGQAPNLAQTTGGTLLPTGSIRVRQGVQVSALPGFEEGAWWVQDAAAALPVQLLGDITGLRVVDLCAAPGGKTMQLAAKGATVTALDSSKSRMERVAENLTRTRLEAELITSDARHWAPATAPDIIVLDAPCSATGTLRRHPDQPLVRPAPDLGPLLELQEALIDRALGWLAPGGRLLFCTCSLLPREGETQAARAHARHPGLIEGAPLPVGVDPDWILPSGGLRLRPDYWPEHGGMDGFFATVLTKPG